MGTTLDKTITRNSGNTVAIDTSYSELNTKASGLVNDIVSHVETQLATTETALQTAEGLVDTKIASLLSVGDTGYTKDVVDVNLANQINALAPYSGYTQVSKKLDNFVFQEDANFTYSVADKNRFVKFGDKVVDTYGEELVTNGDFSDGTTGWATARATISNQDGELLIVGDGSANANLGTTSFSTSIGKMYKLTVGKLTSITNESRFVYIGTSNGVGNILTQSNAPSGEYYFVAESVETYIGLGGYANQSVIIDNISVKEIQTADFTNTAPTVTEIITDGSNSTSGAVAKGEYVLDGNGELVTNGTFDTQGDWTFGDGTVAISGGELVFTNSGSAAQIYVGNLIAGETYSITGEVKTISSGELGFYGYPTIGWIGTSRSTTGALTGTFVAGIETEWLWVNTSIGGCTATFDNISVRRVSDVFQAIDDAPLGTALTNTAYFQDKTQIGVTHQSLAYHAYNTITSAYEGIKTEVLLTDTNAGDTTKEVMLANGFSEVSEFLYSKGSYLCLPVGLAQMLNSGSYDPFSNNAGTATRDFGTGYVDWYEYPIRAENVSKLFAYNSIDGYIYSSYGSIGGNALRNTHPQSKFYDIIYADQFKDLREYAKIANKYEIELLREDKRVNSCVDEVSMTKLNDTIASATDGSPYILLYTTERHANNDNIVVFGNDGTMYNNSNSVVRIAQNGANTATYVYIEVANTSNFTVGASFEVYYLDKTNPIISSNTKLSIDLIGSPDNYPDVVKTRLASGVGINGVYPLLVGQDGSDYTSGDLGGVIGSSKMVNYLFNVFNLTEIVSLGGNSDFYGSYIDNELFANGVDYNTYPFYFAVTSYTSNNAPYQITDPKPVLEVTPKAIASNSHSIYKGGDIASQVSGKITVGDSMESKVLENSEPVKYEFSSDDYLGTEVKQYVTIALNLGSSHASPGILGHYYERLGSSFTDTVGTMNWDFGTTTSWKDITVLPTHPTLTLSANNGAKWFETLEEDENGNVYAGVYGEEMVYDTTFGDGDDFEQLTNGTDIDLNGNTVKTFHGSNPLNIKMK
mgnify:CR=1 FL=1